MQHVPNLFNRQLLETLVSIPSWAPEEKKISSVVEKYLLQIGCHVEPVPIALGRNNLLVTRGASPSHILFYGHLDTVKVINPTSWKTNPLTLVEKKGLAYGLGAYDMKGGLSAFISAVEKTTAPVKMMLCVDEEEISEGAWHVFQNRTDFFSDVSLIVSAEPNFGLGLHGITTARTGRCLFTVQIVGTSAHTAQFQTGEDAVKKAATYITKLYAQQDRWYKHYGTVIQVRQIAGESTGMSVMDSVNLVVEVIVGLDDSIEQIQKRLQDIFLTDIQLSKRKTPYLSSYSFKDFPYMTEIRNSIKVHTKKKMTLHHRVSVGDDNVLAQTGIPVITWGPDGGNAHAANEYVSLESLEILTKMYKELLDRLP